MPLKHTKKSLKKRHGIRHEISGSNSWDRCAPNYFPLLSDSGAVDLSVHHLYMGLVSNLPKHPLLSDMKGNQSYPPLYSTPGSGQFQGRSFWLKVIVLFGDMHNDNMFVKF